MQKVEVNSTQYACYIHQQKSSLPYLLILHGFMGDHRVFDHLIDKISEFCNPVAVDLLGFGKSDHPTDPVRYQEKKQVSDLLELVGQLNKNPLFLSGYSMGGRLALKTALAAPEQFAGLILESTTCGITDKAAREERRKTDATRAKQIEKNFKEFLNEWRKLDLFRSPIPQKKDLIKKYQAIQSQQSPQALSASLQGFGTGTMSPACDELKKLDIPALLMAGSADQKYQRINKFLSKQFANATFSSIKAGHRVHLDNPAAYITQLKNFISIN